MLERTAAASVETCGFQNVLPSVVRSPLASRRRLHTAFWNHGGSDLELFGACRLLVLPPTVDTSLNDAREKPAGDRKCMTASAFLLDFLYPTAAVRLFQRSPIDIFYRPQTSRPLTIPTRPFSILPDTAGSDTSLPHNDKECAEFGVSREHTLGVGPLDTHSDGDVYSPTPDILPESPQEGSDQVSSSRRTVESILTASAGRAYGLLWSEYTRLDAHDQEELAAAVIIHLSSSLSKEHIIRLLDLFSRLDKAKWTPQLIETVIRVRRLLGDEAAALDLFGAALERGITSSFDHLLTAYLSDRLWSLSIELLILNARKPEFSEVCNFSQLSEMPHFRYRMERLISLLEQRKSTLEPLKTLFRDIAKSSLSLFSPKDAEYILGHTAEVAPYEYYIRHCIRQDRKNQAWRLYKQYRIMPGAHPSIPFLNEMLTVVEQQNNLGVEKLMEDWYRCHGRMGLTAYRSMARAFAVAGDVEAVRFVSKEWAKYYPRSIAVHQNTWVHNQLTAYAVKGDTVETKRMLDELNHPGIRLWNTWLKAYAEANDYEGCIDAFVHICGVVEPNAYSFTQLMWMAGSRGDLDFVRELYTLATERGLNSDKQIVNCVVEAYCQNEQYSKAEAICHRATRGSSDRAAYAMLWHTMLRHHARMRDLTALTRTLEIMSDYGIPYNGDTYGYLLRGLGNCRQATYAFKLFTSLTDEAVFDPTPKHYVTLTKAFIETGEISKALRIAESMNRQSISDRVDLVVQLIRALGKWVDVENRLPEHQTLESYVPWTLKAFHNVASAGQPKTAKDRRAITKMYSAVLFHLVQTRDFEHIDKILDLWRRQFGTEGDLGSVPRRILDNILLADLYRDDYDHAIKTWNLILERAIQQGRPPKTNPGGAGTTAGEGQGISPAYRYSLTDPLKTMQRLYVAKNDPDGLMLLIDQVRREGFELDNKNWNYYVQGLARLKYLREACRVCEEHLMPNWTGWARKRGTRLKLEIRRLCSTARRPRPISYTLLVLAREYKGFMRRGLWARDAALAHEDLLRNCPRTVYAITTLRPNGERELDLLAGRVWDPIIKPRPPKMPSNTLSPAAEENLMTERLAVRRTVDRLVKTTAAGRDTGSMRPKERSLLSEEITRVDGNSPEGNTQPEQEGDCPQGQTDGPRPPAVREAAVFSAETLPREEAGFSEKDSARKEATLEPAVSPWERLERVVSSSEVPHATVDDSRKVKSEPLRGDMRTRKARSGNGDFEKVVLPKKMLRDRSLGRSVVFFKNQGLEATAASRDTGSDIELDDETAWAADNEAWVTDNEEALDTRLQERGKTGALSEPESTMRTERLRPILLDGDSTELNDPVLSIFWEEDTGISLITEKWEQEREQELQREYEEGVRRLQETPGFKALADAKTFALRQLPGETPPPVPEEELPALAERRRKMAERNRSRAVRRKRLRQARQEKEEERRQKQKAEREAKEAENDAFSKLVTGG